MCRRAYNDDTKEELENIGQIAALVGGMYGVKLNDAYGDDFGLLSDPENMCLCPVDVVGTLFNHGYEVWHTETGDVGFRRHK